VSVAALAVVAAQVTFVAPAVRGEGSCPAAAEVARQLTPLLPASRGADEPEIVELVFAGADAIVRLRGADGRVSHERVLDRAASCDARAEEAAVLVAAWEADLHADVAFPASSGPTPAPMAPASPASAGAPAALAAPAPSLVGPPGATGAGDPAPGVAPVAFVAKRGEGDARPVGLAVGAEVFVAAAGLADAAPAGAVEVTLTTGARVHARLALLATGAHELELTPGRVAWRRAALSAGALADLVRGRVSLQVRASVLAGVVMASGSGFTKNYDATSAEVGADAGLRVGVPLTPRFGLWAELSGAAFPGRERVSVLNVISAPALPSWELDGGLGASFSFFP
jgi:hypothetical protein